jgi:hypothetical protein
MNGQHFDPRNRKTKPPFPENFRARLWVSQSSSLTSALILMLHIE